MAHSQANEKAILRLGSSRGGMRVVRRRLRPIRRDDLLTNRQVEVLQYQASGMRPKEIANLLCVAEATVRMHVRNACSKLGVHSWFAAVMEAQRRGLLDTQSN